MAMTRQRRRRSGRRVLAVLLLACVLTSGLSGIVAAQDGPAFDAVMLSAASVARGGTVTVSAHITDKTADVLESPTIYFLLPDGADGPATDFTRSSGDARDGRYDATVTISPLLPPGQYAVKLLRAYDGDGNIATVMPPDPRLTALTLTVTGGDMPSALGTATPTANAASATAAGTAISTAPVTATASPTPAASATPGAPATVTATAAGTRFPPATEMPAATATVSQPTPTPMFTSVPTTGPGPDLPTTAAPTPTAAARVTVLPAATPTPRAIGMPATVAATPPTAIATATPQPIQPIPTPAVTPTVAPTRIAATARTSASAPAATAPAATATVARTAPRPSPATTTAMAGAGPVLVSLMVSDATVFPADALIVTAHITDGTADILDFPTLRYRLPDGMDGPFAYLRRVDGTARDGTYQAVVGLSPFVAPGTYTIAALTMSDTDGYTIVFSAPTAPQPDATFVVEPFVPPTPTSAPSDAG